MYIVLLRFSENKSLAGNFMQAHNEWLQKGFDDGVFFLAGSLSIGGGAILAKKVERRDLDDVIMNDPFIKEGIVSSEVFEIDPKKANKQLSFLFEDK